MSGHPSCDAVANPESYAFKLLGVQAGNMIRSQLVGLRVHKEDGTGGIGNQFLNLLSQKRKGFRNLERFSQYPRDLVKSLNFDVRGGDFVKDRGIDPGSVFCLRRACTVFLHQGRNSGGDV